MKKVLGIHFVQDVNIGRELPFLLQNLLWSEMLNGYKFGINY